jgi:Zn-dependent metalloprotease
MAKRLSLGARERLEVKAVTKDPDGTTHVRYDRTFAGLPVVGGDLVVHRGAGGAIEGVNDNASGKVSVASTTPTVAAAVARHTSLQQAHLAGERSSETLVVFAGQGAPRLAYDVVVKGFRPDQTPSRLHTIVDARNGKTLATWDDIQNGTGHGIFVGTVTIGSGPVSGGYQLKDGHGNYTTDLRGATSGTGTTFTDADDVWGNGSVSDRASAAVDAQYGAEKTFDFYQNVMGRDGIWDDGRGARSRVHYGNNYVNAFWDGTQMTYGDGSGNTRPLVELDVAAHEMSHGVTENTAGLNYYGDAGGLNEATSDIFGTAVEFYADNPNDVGDYLIGEEIDINGNGTPLRYQDKPSRDGSSPNCWSSSVSGLDPHYSSGPLNHWFYLASEGSGAKTINGVSYDSPTCDGQSMSGIGRAKVEKVWYRALSTYLTSGSTYKDARNAAIRSAKDLYGDGTECTGIQNAFDAIAVPAGAQSCSGATDPGDPPSGDNLLQNPGFESGATVWTGTSGPITTNTGRPAHSGSWKMWLGGNGTSATESESQQVTIPSASSAALSFWLRTDTSESTSSSAYDRMQVQVTSGGTTRALRTWSNLDATGDYRKQTLDLSAYTGRTVTLRFVMQEDSMLQTSFVVDDTSLTTG